MDFWQNFDWMILIRCFIIGGLICVIGQILIDKTKLTPARILVIYVTTGAILGGLGIYKYLVDFAGAGATVPLTGFGYNLAKGSIEAVQESGLVGAFIGGTKAAARWNSCRNIFPVILLLLFQNLKLKKNKMHICILFFYIHNH